MTPGDATADDALRRACRDLDRRVRAGEAARAEDYFAADPSLAASAESAVELVYAEFAARAAAGGDPRPDEWLARFPRWRADLAELFQIHALMHDGPAGRPPRAVGRFELLGELGRGGAGVVYKALDLRLNRPVAVKLLHGPAGMGGGLAGEGGAAARLQHPNIVQVYEVGEADGRPFLALEYVPGGTLAAALAGRPRPSREAAALVETLARAAHYAHLMGVVHCDLKPANVLLAADGTPKIADFGLARRAGGDGGAVVVGTPGYMAPEQAGGPADAIGPAADVYALGAVLAECLAGRPPPGPLPAGLPRDLAAVCRKCLDADPAARYPDAAALADDLRRFLAGEPVAARPAGGWERAWKFARRRPAATALLVLVPLATLAALAGSLRSNALLSAAVGRAEEQSRLYREQSDAARRAAYALQLAHVDALWPRDPARGRELLDDPAACPPDLRDFTWRLLRRLCERERWSAACPGPVVRVAYAPDGSAVAAVSRLAAGDAVTVWDTTTGGQRCRLPAADGAVAGLAFSPDSRALAVARGGAVRTYDPATGGDAGPARAVGRVVLDLAWAADGVALALAGDGPGGAVWFAPPGREPVPLRHEGALAGAAVSPDGGRVAAWGYGGVTVWDGTGRRLGELAGCPDLLAAAFSADGRSFAAGGGDRRAVVWDVATGRVRAVLAGHTNAVRAVAFAPDGRTLATGGEDFAVKLWPAAGGPEAGTLKGHGHVVRALAFAPDGRAFASGGEDGALTLWEAAPGGPMAVPAGHGGKVLALAVSPDGRRAATGGTDGTAAVWDVATARRVATLRGHARMAWAVAFAPDGRTLATAAADGTVRVWDAATGAELRALSCGPPTGPEGQRTNGMGLAFAGGGRTLLAACGDGRLRAWDWAGGRPTAEVEAHPGGALCVALSPDGRALATGGADHDVLVWDAATLAPSRRLTGHHNHVVSVAFDPTGRRLASGGTDRQLTVWDVAGGAGPVACRGHTHWPYAVAFSPDGRTLASGTADRMSNVPGEVKLWDPASGRVRSGLPGRTGPVAFAAGGAVLIASDLGGDLLFYRVTPAGAGG